MSSTWHEKKAKQAAFQFEKDLVTAPSCTAINTDKLISDVAMGGGDVQVFERKLTKEEKKAQAKAKREAKKNQKGGTDNDDDIDEDDNDVRLQNLDLNTDGVGNDKNNTTQHTNDDGLDHELTDLLSASGTICTYALNRKGIDHRSRDINIQNFTLQHMGNILLDETEIVLNHGNRYGLIARNGKLISYLLVVCNTTYNE